MPSNLFLIERGLVASIRRFEILYPCHLSYSLIVWFRSFKTTLMVLEERAGYTPLLEMVERLHMYSPL